MRSKRGKTGRKTKDENEPVNEKRVRRATSDLLRPRQRVLTGELRDLNRRENVDLSADAESSETCSKPFPRQLRRKEEARGRTRRTTKAPTVAETIFVHRNVVLLTARDLDDFLAFQSTADEERGGLNGEEDTGTGDVFSRLEMRKGDERREQRRSEEGKEERKGKNKDVPLHSPKLPSLPSRQHTHSHSPSRTTYAEFRTTPEQPFRREGRL